MKFKPTIIILIFWLLWTTLSCGSFYAFIYPGITSDDIKPVNTMFSITYISICVFAILYFKSIKYVLDDKYITRKSGVLWKKRRSIPLEKITNLDVRQGPIERILGFGQLWLYTPSTGSDKPEEKLIGIVEPHSLRETILNKKDGMLSSDGKVPTSDESVTDVLMEIRDILKEIRDKRA